MSLFSTIFLTIFLLSIFFNGVLSKTKRTCVCDAFDGMDCDYQHNCKYITDHGICRSLKWYQCHVSTDCTTRTVNDQGIVAQDWPFDCSDYYEINQNYDADVTPAPTTPSPTTATPTKQQSQPDPAPKPKPEPNPEPKPEPPPQPDPSGPMGCVAAGMVNKEFCRCRSDCSGTECYDGITDTDWSDGAYCAEGECCCGKGCSQDAYPASIDDYSNEDMEAIDINDNMKTNFNSPKYQSLSTLIAVTFVLLLCCCLLYWKKDNNKQYEPLMDKLDEYDYDKGYATFNKI